MSLAFFERATRPASTDGEPADSVVEATETALSRAGLTPADRKAAVPRTKVLRERHAAQMAAIRRLPRRERLLLTPLFDGALAVLLANLPPA
jgi:hypothetical protein